MSKQAGSVVSEFLSEIESAQSSILAVILVILVCKIWLPGSCISKVQDKATWKFESYDFYMCNIAKNTLDVQVETWQ
jgi:hypothetical protein